MKKERKKKEEPLPTIVDLIEQYRDGLLPPDQLVFKYQSQTGPRLIHKDELYKEAVIAGIYSVMHQDRLIGARTAPEDPMKGLDQTNWEKTRKLK